MISFRHRVNNVITDNSLAANVVPGLSVVKSKSAFKSEKVLQLAFEQEVSVHYAIIWNLRIGMDSHCSLGKITLLKHTVNSKLPFALPSNS